MKKSVERAIELLAEQIGGVLYKNVITISYKGKQYTITYTLGSNDLKNSEKTSKSAFYASELSVSTVIDINSGFLIFRETFMDKVSKFFGLKKEYQTGFEEFDKKYLIRVDDEPFAKKMFRDYEIRNLVDWFFSERYECISCCGEILEVSLFPFVFSQEDSQVLMLETFRKMSDFSDLLLGIND